MKKFFASLILAASISAPAFAQMHENVPLVWKPTTSLTKLGAVDLTHIGDVKVQIASFTDARKAERPELIAENREKSDVRTVTTSGDIPGFVSTNMRKLMETAGFNMVDQGGDVLLHVELKSFFVTETNTYLGEVGMKVTAKNRAGKVLWVGMTGGAGKRFGRSYKMDNYYETLSDAIIEATHNMLTNQGFRTALEKK